MSYAGFLGFFLVVPILLLGCLLRQRLLDKRYWLTTALLSIFVLIAMAPWDHTAVSWGIWNWTTPQTWGVRLWSIPLEEYLFALLEAVLATMCCYACGLWLRQRTRT